MLFSSAHFLVGRAGLLAKAQFVELLADQLNVREGRATDSAISVMTGLHRRDVVRFKNGNVVLDKAHDIVSKVLGQWQADKRFLDASGKPRVLTYGSEQSEFSKLVHMVSNDISASSVLGEIERIQSVERTGEGLHLRLSTYVSKGNLINGFRILSDDIEDLSQVVKENILCDSKIPNMHFRTVYDRVDPRALPKIKRWLLDRGNELHIQARQFISKFDLDINPSASASEKGPRVVVSSYSLASEILLIIRDNQIKIASLKFPS